MDRRAFLATAAAVTAGCGQAGDETETQDGATPTREPAGTGETRSDVPTETPTPEPASIAVTGVSAPSTIEIGTAGTLSVTLENTGGQSGSFSGVVETRIGSGEWQTTDVTVEVTVPSDEALTEAVDLPPHGYVEPASYRLADAEPVARTRFVPRELPLGDTHTLPNGVELTVADPRFTDTYTYESGDGSAAADPSGGDKWAIGTVRAENPTDSPVRAPLVSDIAFFRGSEEYSYQHLGDNRDRYRGGDLEAGGVTEGDLPTNVPADAEMADLRVEYSEDVEAGTITVNWLIGE